MDFLSPHVTGLDRVRGAEIAPLLDEEVESWRQKLNWDYRPSSELIHKFVGLEQLGGYALLMRGKPVGYVYTVIEERKSTIGGLFVAAAYRNERNEGLLLEAALAELFKTTGVRRVQAQLMLLDNPLTRLYPRPEWMHIYEREFMDMSLEDVFAFAEVVPRWPVYFEPWTPACISESAGLVARAYVGHVDGRINEMYCTASGSHKFLENVVQYPGCGGFYQPASFAARDVITKRLIGIVMASMVSHETGHITQVCVSPEAKGMSLGYELMRRSMVAMAGQRLRRVGLTVTSANEAVRLYQQMGFAKRSIFAALVWDGF